MNRQFYTKTGDKGDTGLIGGERVKKNSNRVNAYGTIDELNSLIGYVISQLTENDRVLKREIIEIQHNLFDCGTDLADSHGKLKCKVTEEMVQNLEAMIDDYADKAPLIESFVLPGGHPVAIYLNRLSDYLYAATRAVDCTYNVKEILYERGGKVFHPELKKEDLK